MASVESVLRSNESDTLSQYTRRHENTHKLGEHLSPSLDMKIQGAKKVMRLEQWVHTRTQFNKLRLQAVRCIRDRRHHVLLREKREEKHFQVLETVHFFSQIFSLPAEKMFFSSDISAVGKK